MSLYPTDWSHVWCSRADYDVILRVARELGARRVLELGPGISTLALVEAGCEEIDCCEDDGHWRDVYKERIAAVHSQVRIYGYALGFGPISIDRIDHRRYDLGMVDGPRDVSQRPAAIRYCLDRCAHVLVPLEEEGERSYRLRDALRGLTTRPITFMNNTGPLAGSWALVSP